MSYTPTTWQTGDTVTATKLNNMETGIGNAANPFIVTLTPTALDYSGTMDCTVADIYAAYQAEKKIVFRVFTGAGDYLEADATMRVAESSYTYPMFIVLILDNTQDVLICAYTLRTDDGTKNTYSTIVYSLTRAS